MLSKQEIDFISYWEMVRGEKSKTINKILQGLPVALLFALPILLTIVAVYFFFPDWYTKISNFPKDIFFTLIIATLICMIFFAFTHMHYKWENNEQLYLELKHKLKKEENAQSST